MIQLYILIITIDKMEIFIGKQYTLTCKFKFFEEKSLKNKL